jgi:hypothetical protein
MQLDQVPDDGETEAGAARVGAVAGAGLVDSIEALEHPREIGFGDAGTLIGHGDDGTVAGAP